MEMKYFSFHLPNIIVNDETHLNDANAIIKAKIYVQR